MYCTLKILQAGIQPTWDIALLAGPEPSRPVISGLLSTHHGPLKLNNAVCGSRRLGVVARTMTSTSKNPAFTFGKVNDAIAESGRGGPSMTVDGAVQKTSLLLVVAVASAVATWVQVGSLKVGDITSYDEMALRVSQNASCPFATCSGHLGPLSCPELPKCSYLLLSSLN